MAVVLGVACAVAFGAAAGAVDAPVLDEGTGFDVGVEPGELLTLPTGPAEDAPDPGQAPAGRSLFPSGDPGFISIGWMVVVLGLWTVIALRSLNASGAFGALGLAAIVVAAATLLGVGGERAATAPVPSGGVGLLGQLAMVLLGIVTVLSGLALFIPEDARSNVPRLNVLGFLAEAGRDVARTARERPWAGAGTERVEPDNEVYEAWLAVAREHGAADQSPGEVERLAVDEGRPRAAATDLRRVFEEVRYGGSPPDETRVERARRAARRMAETGTSDSAGQSDAPGGTDP